MSYIRVGNNIILSAIWRKQARVNFSKTTKLHKPVVIFEKFTCAYYTKFQEKSCYYLLLIYMNKTRQEGKTDITF